MERPVRQVIISLDGRATLIIPPGALPDHVEPSDLTLEAIADPTITFSPDGEAPLAAYRLRPAGVELQAPVKLTLRISFEQAAEGLYAFHVSGDEIEPISDIEMATNPESETAVASIQLPRFDEIYWWRFGLFSTRFETTYLQVVVGEWFAATATVTSGAGRKISGRHRDAGVTFEVGPADESWSLTGTFRAGQSVADTVAHEEADVQPSLAIDRPALSSMSTGTFTVEQQFDCIYQTGRTGQGGSRIWYEAVVEFQEEFRSTGRGPGAETRVDHRPARAKSLVFLHVDCFLVGSPPRLEPPPATASTPASEPVAQAGSARSFGDGTHVVGMDLEPGLYRTADGPTLCYWERRSSFVPILDAIIAYDFGPRPRIAEIKTSDFAFLSNNCGPWAPAVDPVRDSPMAPLGSGTYIVGLDVTPGAWRAANALSSCNWKRLAGFSGDPEHVIAADSGTGPHVVAIIDADVGFSSSGCGTWEFAP